MFVKDAETGEVVGLHVPFLRTGVMTRVEESLREGTFFLSSLLIARSICCSPSARL